MSEARTSKPVNVFNCDICGQNHTGLIVGDLDRAVWINGERFTRFVVCPVSGEPLFVKGK